MLDCSYAVPPSSRQSLPNQAAVRSCKVVQATEPPQSRGHQKQQKKPGGTRIETEVTSLRGYDNDAS